MIPNPEISLNSIRKIIIFSFQTLFNIRSPLDNNSVSTWLHFAWQNPPKSRLGPSWDGLGGVLAHLGGVLGRSCRPLAPSRAVLAASWAVLEASWGVLEASWGVLRYIRVI